MKITKLLLSAFAIFFNATVFAQTAGEYMSNITKEFEDITVDTWDYLSAVAHGKSARKVENRRREVLKSTLDAQNKVRTLGGYNGDNSLRDSVLAYLKLSYHVINYDYAKIVDMEEVAEQSYDAMEAYMLAQEMASEKLNKANDRLVETQEKFAAKNSVTLNKSEDKIEKKLALASLAFKYYNSAYLIFFKSYKQEAYMIDALNKGDVNAYKQNADALSKTVEEGLKKVDTLRIFKGDNSLKINCKNLLLFYQKEAAKAALVSNFLVKKENFEKINKAFGQKDPKKRSKEDVDSYNNAVNEYNSALNEYNKLNNEQNNNRSNLLNAWNGAVSKFLDSKVPKKR